VNAYNVTRYLYSLNFLLQIRANLIQKDDWVRISIRKEKLKRINRYLKSPIWKPAKLDGIKNPSQYVDNALEKELESTERAEKYFQAEELRGYYKQRKAELKKERGIDNLDEFINFVFSKLEENEDFKNYQKSNTHTPAFKRQIKQRESM